MCLARVIDIVMMLEGSRIDSRFFVACIFALASIFFFCNPTHAHASSLLWGDENGSIPTQVEITDGGTYSVPLNTPASIYMVTPPIGPAFGLLYSVENGVRTQIANVSFHNPNTDPSFAWPAAGAYELDIATFAPPELNFNDTLKRWIAKALFADVAYAQFDPPTVVETLHFTIQDAAASQTLTPVIIIPGILGSAQHNGEWIIDPITHGYDNLIDTLTANGYEKGKTLFPFPYDWHLSNAITATLLKNKISEVKGICGCSQVDIVAHSMGGLVARSYIQSNQYLHDVRKLIFLGTPQMGAPETFLMWEGGQTDVDSNGQKLLTFLKIEAHKKGYMNLFDYEHNFPIPSVQELLPVYGYIKHIGSSNIPTYPNAQWYPNNLFLYNLDANMAKLYGSSVEMSNFVGRTTQDKTITTIRVVATTTPSTAAVWGFGTPEHFGENSTDQGLERGAGDGTVPLSSADLIINDLNIIDSEHNDLPTKTEGQVFKKLTGRDATILVNNAIGTGETLKNILLFQILSPADFVVFAPDGKQIGKNFGAGQEVNEIPGAFYSGFGTDNEFVTIPNPQNGEYKVITQGTGVGGAYTIATGVIDDATSSTTFFTGMTAPNLITEHDVNVDPTKPDATTIIPADQTPPTITFIQPATTTYTHADMLPVKVTFADTTGVATSSVTFDTTQITASSTIDLFLQTLGNHTITASAKDLVNNATTSKRNVMVTATASSTQSDVNRAFTLSWLTSKDLKNLLITQLDQVIKLQKVTSTIPVPGNPKKTQTITTIVRIVDKILLQAMLAELQLAKNAKLVNAQGYQILTSDINWLINH